MRSAATFFDTAAAAAAAASAAEPPDGNRASAKVTLPPITPSSNEEEEDEDKKRVCRNQATEITADGLIAGDEERTKAPRPREDAGNKTAAVGLDSNRPRLRRPFPPSFMTVLDGLESGQRQALLRAWDFDATVTSPHCPEEKPAVTGG